MTALSLVLVLVAVAIGVFSKGLKTGLALVISALAVAMFWHDNFSTLDWVIFWIIFVAGLIYTAGGRYRVGARVGAGLAVLIVTALLATTLNAGSVFDGFGVNRAALIAEMREGVKKDVDKANARLDAIEKKNLEQDATLADHDSRLDKLEANDKAQDKMLSDLTEKVTGIVTTAPPIDLSSDQIADAVATDLVDQGFRAGDITVGTINWDENGYDVGSRPFVDSSIDSLAKLRKQLNASTSQAKSTRAHLLGAVPTSEEQRMLSGRGFVPIQFNKRVCLEGNTYFLGGKAVRDGIRCHEAGDVIWVYIGSNGKVYWDASVRADCGNGGMSSPPRPTKDKPKKDKPSTPGTPGTPSTPGTPTTPSTSTPTPTPSKSTSTPTPTPSCPTGRYCTPKATATPPPSQSPRPGGTTTAKPSPRPTHTGPTLTSGPTATVRPTSDGHTPTRTTAPTVLPTPTASGTIGDG